MDYKAKLQTNNLDLNEILGTINTLPEAGGVTMPEMCTVTFDYICNENNYGPADFNVEYMGLDESGQLIRKFETNPESIQCIGYIYVYMATIAPNGYFVEMQVGDDNWGAIYSPHTAGEETMMAVYESCHISFIYKEI